MTSFTFHRVLNQFRQNKSFTSQLESGDVRVSGGFSAFHSDRKFQHSTFPELVIRVKLQIY